MPVQKCDAWNSMTIQIHWKLVLVGVMVNLLSHNIHVSVFQFPTHRTPSEWYATIMAYGFDPQYIEIRLSVWFTPILVDFTRPTAAAFLSADSRALSFTAARCIPAKTLSHAPPNPLQTKDGCYSASAKLNYFSLDTECMGVIFATIPPHTVTHAYTHKHTLATLMILLSWCGSRILRQLGRSFLSPGL